MINTLDIFGIICFVGMIYFYGLKNGIKFFIFLALVGGLVGLVQSGLFFGKLGEYIFLLLLVVYGFFLQFKCQKKLSESIEGQKSCIKHAFDQLLSYVKK